MNANSIQLINSELKKLYPNEQQTTDILKQFQDNVENNLLIETKYKLKDIIVQKLYDKGIYSKENYTKQIQQIQTILGNQYTIQMFHQKLKQQHKISPQAIVEAKIQQAAARSQDDLKKILKLRTKRQNILYDLQKQIFK